MPQIAAMKRKANNTPKEPISFASLASGAYSLVTKSTARSMALLKASAMRIIHVEKKRTILETMLILMNISVIPMSVITASCILKDVSLLNTAFAPLSA